MSGYPTSLYKIINGLRLCGVGSKVTRTIYKFPETYWQITRVELSKDQNHGKVFGRMVWRGRPKEIEERLGSTLKKEWRLVSLPDYSQPIVPTTAPRRKPRQPPALASSTSSSTWTVKISLTLLQIIIPSLSLSLSFSLSLFFSLHPSPSLLQIMLALGR